GALAQGPLASNDAAKAAERSAGGRSLPRCKPRHEPRGHLPRRRRSKEFHDDPGPRCRQPRMEVPRLLPDDDSLPPDRRDRAVEALPRHAGLERALRAAVQPASRPGRTPLQGPLRGLRDRRRGWARGELSLRSRDPGSRGALRKAERLALERVPCARRAVAKAWSRDCPRTGTVPSKPWHRP